MALSSSVLVVLAAAVIGEHPLHIGDDAPDRIIITTTAQPPAEPVADVGMARAVVGRLAELEGRDLAAFIRSAPLNPQPTAAADGERVVAWLHLERGDARKVVEVVRTPAGSLVVRDAEAPDDPASRAPLKADAFEGIVDFWTTYRGGLFEGDAQPPLERGTIVTIADGIDPAPVLLDEQTLIERVYRGLRVKSMEPATRRIEDESMAVRLPKGWEPRSARPLLVWINPTPSIAPDEALDPVLDELGMVAVSVAGAGNDRPLHDRMQVMLDAVATVSARYLIDDDSIYVAGFSGGGRTASMLWGTFPDVFDGAAAFAGLNSYNDANAGPGKIWPRAFAKPRGDLLKLLRTRRLAVVSGESDFNDENSRAQYRLLERERMPVRLFLYDMGHEVPAPDRVADIIRWIDEPARERRAADLFEARETLDAYFDAYGPDTRAPDAKARAMLTEVMESAPWTRPAWAALELLGRPEEAP